MTYNRVLKYLILAVILFFLPGANIFAWEYYQKDGYPASATSHSMQLHVAADFDKKWSNGIRLSLSEDLRFDLFNTAPSKYIDNAAGTAFDKSYTTLTFGYSPVSCFKADAGYTLRLLGTKGYDDVNEFLRHRVFFGVTGTLKVGIAKLYLRERVMCDMRTDSVNLEEKNRYNWLLRSRVGTEFTINGKPLKPYAWLELINTLNAPEYQLYYKNNDPTTNHGQQYVSSVRAAVGTKWKLNRNNSLNFFYRFTYSYDRDININSGYYNESKPKELKVRLTEEKSYQHAIGITYEFGW